MNEKYKPLIDYYNSMEEFNNHNGIVFTDMDDGYVECRVDLTSASVNGQGTAHGGLVFALADVVAGISVSPSERPCVTSSANISYLRPGLGSYLRAVGRPLKVGKKMAVGEAWVYDDQDRLVAKGTLSYCFTD